MPLLSSVGIISRQGCAEQLVLALSAVVLYHSAGICCCVSAWALILQTEPRVDEFLPFFQRLCRGSCEALPAESISCFAGMRKPDDFSMCPAKIIPDNLVCILISQPCWEKLIHHRSPPPWAVCACRHACWKVAPAVVGLTPAAALSAGSGRLKATSGAPGWPGERWCCDGEGWPTGWKAQQDTWLLSFVWLAEAGYKWWLPPAPSPERLSSAEQMPGSVWLFFPAGGAESLLFFKENVRLPPDGLSPCVAKPVSLLRLL